MSGADGNFKQPISEKEAYIENVQRLYKMEKHNNPNNTGKFHDFLLEMSYRQFKNNRVLSSDLGQAWNTLGDLNRKLENVHNTGDEEDDSWRDPKAPILPTNPNP